MKNRALLSVLLTLAVVGCATTSGWGQPGPSSTRKDCGVNGVKCDLIVTVSSCKPDGSGISVDFPELAVKKGTPPGKITWTISPSTFKFSSNGIAFKPGVDFGKEFDTPDGNGNVFKWHDRNDQNTGLPRPYPYSITVEDSSGNSCGTLDPTIINDA